MTTLAQVKAAQPEWFSRGNKRFFGDVGYKVLHGKISHKPFLVRSTYAWSDMFGQPKRLSYRINPLGDDLKIQFMENIPFLDMGAVRNWLSTH